MKTRNIWHHTKLLPLFVLCGFVALTPEGVQSQRGDGKLIVIVTLGDIENTPAGNVLVYARGYLSGTFPSETATILNPTRQGRYEASLVPGLYDVFVSESTSSPRCKRVEIKPSEEEFWTLKLEIDHEHLEK